MALTLTPVAGVLLSACGGDGQGTDTSSLETVPQSANHQYSFTFTKYPALQNAGGAILVNVAANSGTVPVAVVRTDTATAVALNAVCPHQGCAVNPFDSTAKTFTCACHGSVFSEAGAVQKGPANTPLSSYTATVSATDISATIP